MSLLSVKNSSSSNSFLKSSAASSPFFAPPTYSNSSYTSWPLSLMEFLMAVIYFSESRVLRMISATSERVFYLKGFWVNGEVPGWGLTACC